MKQLVICSSFPYSTHTFVTREIAETLSRGHEVVILAPYEGDIHGQEMAKRFGIGPERVIYSNVVDAPVFSPSWLRFTSRVRKASQKEIYGRKFAEKRKSFFSKILKNPLLQGVDIIHAHFSGWAYEIAMPLSKLLGIPFTFTAHDSFLAILPEYYFNTLQQNAAAITFPSEIWRDMWVSKTHCKDRLYVLSNGVAIDSFPINRIYANKKTICIISVSRLTPIKRICDGLHATRRLLNNGIVCHYTIIGSGPEEGALHELARKLDIENCVSFLGAQSHERVILELQKSDICIHPSENESFGVAVIEAMAAGLPVIAALNGGTQETVEHGKTGLLYSPGDVNSLLQGLLKLANDVDLRESYGKSGRARVEQLYSWDSHMEKLLALWNRVVESNLVHGKN
jgi:glycosyltransferase involved in cell wall biosynthesis